MPMQSDGTFSRIWKFVDHRNQGDKVTRADLDIAIDDVVSGVSQSLIASERFESIAEFAASGIEPDRLEAGTLFRVGQMIYKVTAPGQAAHILSGSGPSGVGGLGGVEAGMFFTSEARAKTGDTLGAPIIFVEGNPFIATDGATDLITGDGRAFKKSFMFADELAAAVEDATAEAKRYMDEAQVARQFADAARISAIAAADSAFVNADVYPSISAGLLGTKAGDQFQVVVGDEIIRYRHDFDFSGVSITAQNAIVQRITGEVAYEKAISTAPAPASLTKILTALTACRVFQSAGTNLNTLEIPILAEDVATGSGANVVDGDILSFREALLNLFLASSNTTANAIARVAGALIGGAGVEVDSFVAEMNSVMTSLGVSPGTNFVNPSGLGDVNQRATPDDINRVVIAAADYDIIRDTWGVGSATLTVAGTDPRDESISHSVSMVSDSDVLGAKSGTIVGSHYNASAYVKVSNGDLFAITVMQAATSESRYADIRALINAASSDGDGKAVELARYPTAASLGNYPADMASEVTADWDSINVSGTYRNGNDGPTGGPITQANLLLRHIEGLSPRATQLCYDTLNGRQWRRSRDSSNVWGAWVEVPSSADLDTAVQAVVDGIGSYPPNMTNKVTTDWDSISVSGTYRNGNDGPTGGPITQANLLLYHVQGLSPRAAQICYDTLNGRQWRRFRGSDGAWRDWVEVQSQEALFSADLDAIDVTGAYRSVTAVGQPIPVTHTVTQHIEGTSGRGYQVAQWGYFQPGVDGAALKIGTASRFRLSDGTWSKWQRQLDSGMAQRAVDAGDSEPFTSAAAVHIRPPMSDYFRDDENAIYTTSTEMNDRYRQLVTDFPDYVSEEYLGADLQGNGIWSLTFDPAPIIGLRSEYPPNSLEHPKICLTSGVHPNERQAMVATLAAMDSLCRHWRDDEMLTWLRWNAKIVLVPVVNPSGVNQGHTRTNHNGVDLNRNFPTGWTPTEANPGPSAGSEAETQLLLTWLAAHADAAAIVDHHSHGNAGYPLWFIANSPDLPTIERVGREQHAWMKRDILDEEGNAARYAISPFSGSGMVAEHARATLNVPSHVLEGPISSLPSVSGLSDRNFRLMNAKALIRCMYEWSRT